jgi:CheY-like chemotaxis protein
MKTILLVEDDAIIALAEKKLLEEHGYRILNAYNANAAIEAADEQVIDLILMDIDLGEGKMDGTEAAERILQRHDIPIVFCTGHSEKEYVDRVKGITSYGYVVKDSGDFVLLQSIEMAFQLFEAHKHITDKNMEIARVNEELRVTIEDLEQSNRELMQRDERLDRLNKSLKTVGECNQILVRSADERSLMEDICRAVVENAGYLTAWVGFVGTDDEKRL